MEIWTKEELYMLKGKSWKAQDAQKREKCPTQQRECVRLIWLFL